MTERKIPERTYEGPDHHAGAARRYFHARDQVTRTMGQASNRVDAVQWHPGMAVEGATILSNETGPYIVLPLPRGRRYLIDGDWIVFSAGEMYVYSDESFKEKFEVA